MKFHEPIQLKILQDYGRIFSNNCTQDNYVQGYIYSLSQNSLWSTFGWFLTKIHIPVKEVTLKTMNRKISKISLTSLTHYLFLLIQNSQELIKIRSYFRSLLFDMSHRSATYQKKGEWMGVLILIRLSQEQKQIYIDLYWKFRHRFRSNRIPRTVF